KAKVHPLFGSKIKSSLAILDKGEEIAFRNLKVRAVSNTPAPALAAPAPAAPMASPATPVSVKAAWKLPPAPPPPILK
ncbi:MAG: hypothetical protein ABIZ56_10005, partial [Chthoniobacteraceae bacterium]